MAENQMPEWLCARGINVNRTYSFINNAGFYALAGDNLYDYYQMVVRQLAGWLDGYVYDFHDREEGIFSTRLATSLVKGITGQIVGTDLYFKADSDSKESLNFINRWQDKAGMQLAIRNAVSYALGLGTSALKINAGINELWLEAKRLDQFFFSVDMRGNVIEYTGLIKNFMRSGMKNGKKVEENYYLVEHRYFKYDRKRVYTDHGENKFTYHIERTPIPYVEYSCHKLVGQTRNNQANNFSNDGKIRFESLPKDFRDSIFKEFGIHELDKEYKLPFVNSLGIVLFKNDGGDITLPNIPFGTSLLQDIQSYLMAYDLEFSYYVRDMYLGKGMVLLPKYLSMNKKDTGVLNSLDKSVFYFVPTSDPDKMHPTNVQFDMRVEQHELSQDNILKKIATAIGMSPTTIASYLRQGFSNDKTATEINAEDNATVNFVDVKRKIFEKPINEIIEIVLNYYGYPNDVRIKFATPSIINKDKIVDRAIKEYESGFITLRDAVKMVNPDDSEEEIDQKLKELEEEQPLKDLSNDSFVAETPNDLPPTGEEVVEGLQGEAF